MFRCTKPIAFLTPEDFILISVRVTIQVTRFLLFFFDDAVVMILSITLECFQQYFFCMLLWMRFTEKGGRRSVIFGFAIFSSRKVNIRVKTANTLRALLSVNFQCFSYHITLTGRFRRLGRCFIDWATAVVSEGDTCQF